MHKLEQMITEWRKARCASREVDNETIDELENHVRETAEQLIRSGMSETEAFESAIKQLGSTLTLSSEFRKLNPPVWWPVKVVIGTGMLMAIILAIFLGGRVLGRGSDKLLIAHVYTLTLGYLSVFLLGALGICFVCHRCFSDFSSTRLYFLRRVSLVFSALAAGLTAAGIVLAMLWAKAEWGRYWAWDPKETGGLSVLLWLVIVLTSHIFRGISTRSLFLLSILGNVAVSFAWVIQVSASSLHSYGISNHGIVLMVVAISSLGFLLLGLLPAGCLRSGKPAA